MSKFGNLTTGEAALVVVLPDGSLSIMELEMSSMSLDTETIDIGSFCNPHEVLVGKTSVNLVGVVKRELRIAT